MIDTLRDGYQAALVDAAKALRHDGPQGVAAWVADSATVVTLARIGMDAETEGVCLENVTDEIPEQPTPVALWS